MKKALIVLSLTSSVCSALEWPDFSTAYKHNTLFRGGYQDTQIGQDLYQITFTGNSFTTQQKAFHYALIRAAEVAQKNNDPYFIILDKMHETSNDLHIGMYTVCPIDGLPPFLGYMSVATYFTSTSTSPTHILTIKTFKDKPNCENYLVASDILTANAGVLNQRSK
jgi:hypothetical protein